MTELNVIGYADIDLSKYEKWLKASLHSWLVDRWKNTFCPLQSKLDHKVYDVSFEIVVDSSNSYHMSEECINKVNINISENIINKIKNRLDYIHKFNQRIPVLLQHDDFFVIRLGSMLIYIPTKSDCIKYTPLVDYDKLTVCELKQLSGSINADTSLSIYDDSLSQSITSIDDAISSVSSNQSKLDDLKKNVESGDVPELQKLKEEIQKKQQEMKAIQEKLMAELLQKQNEYELQKQELENKLFMLNVQIYGIRCYLGEVIDFVQLRQGRRCNIEDPLVIYQKFHYLDEELGKLVSIYDVTFEDVKYFEELLQCRDDVLDTFCPSHKCVSIVRVCREQRAFYQEPYQNILQEYIQDHDVTSIGIILRDNENVYIGWTDHTNVKLSDDLFYTPKETVISSEDSNRSYSSSKEEVASRYFIFNILSGVLDEKLNNRLIYIPKIESILSPNNYIIWSAADNALEDNRFGTLSDIIERCNQDTKLNDFIISTQHIYASSGVNRYTSWSNERGVGDRNRTAGLSINNNKVYKINRVDFEGSKYYYDTGLTEDYTDYNYDYNLHQSVKVNKQRKIVFDYWFDNNDTVKSVEERCRNFCESNRIEFDESKVDINLHTNMYVSILKDDSDYVYDGGRYSERKRNSYANFRIDSDEYINLSIMNSVWLEYLITNHSKIQQEYIGGKRINYSHFIPYLNNMMQFVKNREKEEESIISNYVDLTKYENWREKLSDWKISTGKHTIGPRYGKQFANHLIEAISRLD